MLSRRAFFGALAGGAALALTGRDVFAQQGRGGPAMTIYKSPTCGCCANWVEHAQGAGFRTTVRDLDAAAMAEVKQRYGITARLQSCHTAVVNGYAVEGHVPADLVQRLLRQRPRGVVGIAAPGMPVGSPGMEMGARRDPYDVLAWDRRGRITLFASR
ncbi:MAG TPA: DUF411 domain-containing protein [Longimicrobiaceae bacterium]|nr:DUF411 domain-containing protein [Longimicrobiaceae bacterium]